ncbi:MAG: DNA repair protein RadC [Muribaculaceae bacterium]|nr:DNA repair protein RadC [Muribaculaceae bacterium]
MIVKNREDRDTGSGTAGIPQSVRPKVKDMSPDDTPRERAEKYGCGILSVADLWALILRTGTVGNPITHLCRELMKHNDDRLRVLERRTRQEILGIKGLGKLKALQIEAVMELIRRYNGEPPAENPRIRCSADIYATVRQALGGLDHEEVWVLLLNRRHEAVKFVQLSKGGWSSSIFDVKMLIKEALLENASSLALCHNHPSGNLNPSPQDDNITRVCKQACGTMELNMIDHLIVTADSYYSYADQGRL